MLEALVKLLLRSFHHQLIMHGPWKNNTQCTAHGRPLSCKATVVNCRALHALIMSCQTMQLLWNMHLSGWLSLSLSSTVHSPSLASYRIERGNSWRVNWCLGSSKVLSIIVYLIQKPQVPSLQSPYDSDAGHHLNSITRCHAVDALCHMEALFIRRY